MVFEVVLGFVAFTIVGFIFGLVYGERLARRGRPVLADDVPRLRLNGSFQVVCPGVSSDTIWIIDEMRFGWQRGRGDYLTLTCLPAIEKLDPPPVIHHG